MAFFPENSGFLSIFEPKMLSKALPKHPFGLPKSLLFRRGAFWRSPGPFWLAFGTILVAFGHHFGSPGTLSAPFWSPRTPFQLHFGTLWRNSYGKACFFLLLLRCCPTAAKQQRNSTEAFVATGAAGCRASDVHPAAPRGTRAQRRSASHVFSQEVRLKEQISYSKGVPQPFNDTLRAFWLQTTLLTTPYGRFWHRGTLLTTSYERFGSKRPF